MTTSISLENQVAIVTGGGRGIGRAIAREFAAAGASVAVVARSEEQLAGTVSVIREANGKAMAFPVDVTDEKAVRAMVGQVEQKLGAPDILVNNAGVGGPYGPTWEINPRDWWHTIEVNFKGPFLCSVAVLPGMVSRRRGRIINMASGAALRPLSFDSAYCASKTALVRFTETLASETRDYGVTIFAMRPGLVDTAINQYLANSPEGQKWLPDICEQLAQGKDIPPERAAQLALLLASGKADALSGRFFSVYDDVTQVLNKQAEIVRDNLLTLKLSTLK